jgi:hypothetical protein
MNKKNGIEKSYYETVTNCQIPYYITNFKNKKVVTEVGRHYTKNCIKSIELE